MVINTSKFDTCCAGVGPTTGGMTPRGPNGESLFYGRSRTDRYIRPIQQPKPEVTE